MTSRTIKAYHGSDANDAASPCWFTTHRPSAAYFGEVRECTITLDDSVELDEDDERLDADGWDGDAQAYAILEEENVDGLILHGWECPSDHFAILINPDYALVDWS